MKTHREWRDYGDIPFTNKGLSANEELMRSIANLQRIISLSHNGKQTE